MSAIDAIAVEPTAAAALGYRMPAEWEPHEATWIAWPHKRDDWPGKFAPIPWVYAEIVRHLRRGERVRILVNDAADAKRARDVLDARRRRPRARRVLRGADRPRLDPRLPARSSSSTTATARSAARSTGGSTAGRSTTNHQRDDRGRRAHRRSGSACRAGSRSRVDGDRARRARRAARIDVNGQGTLLTTEECLLERRCRRATRASTARRLERVFADYLGVRKVLWLGRGIAGDDTHGHVDDLARFVDPTHGRRAPSRRPATTRTTSRCARTASGSSGMTDAGRARRCAWCRCRCRAPLVFDGQRLPASYANFYIANEAVLVPTFNDPNDRVALDDPGRALPRPRRVVGIHAVDLVWGLGTLHCMTQQEPAARRRRARVARSRAARGSAAADKKQ